MAFLLSADNKETIVNVSFYVQDLGDVSEENQVKEPTNLGILNFTY